MNHRHQNTRDIFSFPSTPKTQDQDSDFEFGCFTPDSPTTDPYNNSPADHLFYNGKLLPHSFPLQQQQQPPAPASISRTTSRTSSRDSLMSSRSNSVSSSRSSVSCSSARTSSSDNSERRLLYHTAKLSSSTTPMASKVVMAQLYGSSQRWQHIVPVPVLKREDSKRKIINNNGVLVKNGSILISHKKKKEDDNQIQQGKTEKSSYGLCFRFFKSFLVACRECHAMEPSTNDDILQASIKL